MPIGTVAHTHLPYCLQKTEDGKWLALNRKYKPVGSVGDDWVDYETHPARQKLHAATVAALKRQAVHVFEDKPGRPASIYFYDDVTIPTDSDAKWVRYSKMLSLWANASVK